MSKEKIAVAYSGGLDTSVMIKWLKDKYEGAEIVAVTGNLGQKMEIDNLEPKAVATGAKSFHFVDLRQQFVENYIWKALKAGALYEDVYPLATALGRPLLATALVDVALAEGCTMLTHGCTGKGNDQVRIEVSARALQPGITVLAPARVWGMTRAGEIAYAAARRIPAPVTQPSPYNVDINLWGRSIQSGPLEDPWDEPPADVYALTADAARCPDTPAYVEIGFERGVPCAVNGVAMPFIDVIGSLATIAGSHGVGRLDAVENRLVGIKSREVYEAPAAVVLHQAHLDLESFVTPRDLERVKREMSLEYANLVYNGLWHSTLREAIDAFVATTQARVTGTVRIKLFKGSSHVVGRQSPFALYDHALATYDEGDRYDHKAAEGFIKIWGLPLETAARRANPGAPPRRTETA